MTWKKNRFHIITYMEPLCNLERNFIISGLPCKPGKKDVVALRNLLIKPKATFKGAVLF